MTDKLELDISANDILITSAGRVAYSQAVSLKRIADALEKLTKIPTMPELTPEQLAEFEIQFSKAPGIITSFP